MKCPHCGIETGEKPLHEWFFATYEVSRYVCDHCDGKFNVYKSEGKFKFTIPKPLDV